MANPSNKELLRTEAQERMDNPDFQHLTRTILDYHQSVGALLGVCHVRGFEFSIVDPVTLRVTPDVGADRGVVVLPELGSADNVHGAGVTSGNIIADVNTLPLDTSFAALATGEYYAVYATVLFSPTRNEQRVFWNPTDEKEEIKAIDTRFQLQWQLTVQRHDVAAPVRSVRLGYVFWDGTLDAGDLYQSAEMLFEGRAGNGSGAVPVPAGGAVPFAGITSRLPDFSRDVDRWTNGAKTFAEFAWYLLKSVEEIKSQHIDNDDGWQAKPLNGLSLRAAQSPTFTLGTGDQLSEGNDNGAEDTIDNPGYHDIGTELTTLVFLARAAGLDSVHIHLKPGRYVVKQAIFIDHVIDIEISGSGVGSTELRFYDVGQLQFIVNAAADNAGKLVIRDMLISSASSVADELLDVQGSTFSAGVDNPIHLRNLRITHAGTADLLALTQSGNNVRLHVDNVRGDDGIEANIRLLTCNRLVVRDSVLGHVLVSNIGGTADPAADVSGSVLRSLRIDADMGAVRVRSSTLAALRVVGGDELVVDGVTFTEAGTLADIDATALAEVLLANLVTRVHIKSCTFKSRSDAALVDGVLLDTCGRAVVQACDFLHVLNSPAGSTGVRSTGMAPTIGELRATVKGCYFQDYAANGFASVAVLDTTIVSEVVGAFGETVIDGGQVVSGCEFIMAGGVPDVLWTGDLQRIEHSFVRATTIDASSLAITVSALKLHGVQFRITGSVLIVADLFHLRNVTFDSLGAVQTVQLTPSSACKRVVLEGVKVPGNLSMVALAGDNVSLRVVDCEVAGRVTAQAGWINVDLADSVFSRGFDVRAANLGEKSLFSARGCAFWDKRDYFEGSDAQTMLNAAAAVSDAPGLSIFPLSASSRTFHRIEISDCSFFQDISAVGAHPAVNIGQFAGNQAAFSTSIQSCFFRLLWPDGVSSDAGLVLPLGKLQFKGNTIDLRNAPGAAAPEMGDIVRMLPITDVTSRVQVQFDNNTIAADDNAVSLADDQAILKIAQTGASSTPQLGQFSFCHNVVRMSFESDARVVWSDQANGVTNFTIRQGIAADNIIRDPNGNITALATSPPPAGANMIDAFNGPDGIIHDNIFA